MSSNTNGPIFRQEREQKRLMIFCMYIKQVRKNINFQSDMHKVLVEYHLQYKQKRRLCFCINHANYLGTLNSYCTK